MGNLRGRVALVTGAGRRDGIGAAVARRLAHDGAHVVVADICAPPTELLTAASGEWEEMGAVAREIETLGVHALPVRVDVTDSASVQAMVAQVREVFGRLDILVNNAGAAIAPNPIVFMEEEAWRRTLEINATGTFLVCKYALPPMIDGERGGRVVNMASIAAERPKPYNGAYAASKAAIIALTRALAQEVAPFGITVNAVLPGDIDTGMKRWGMELEATSMEKTFEEVMSAIVARIPLGRLGTPNDVADLVAFLVSDEASFITAQAINLTGGREVT